MIYRGGNGRRTRRDHDCAGIAIDPRWNGVGDLADGVRLIIAGDQGALVRLRSRAHVNVIRNRYVLRIHHLEAGEARRDLRFRKVIRRPNQPTPADHEQRERCRNPTLEGAPKTRLGDAIPLTQIRR